MHATMVEVTVEKSAEGGQCRSGMTVVKDELMKLGGKKINFYIIRKKSPFFQLKLDT